MDALTDPAALRDTLAAEYARLRTAAEAAPLGTPVPTCPDWSLADLTTHVAQVYLHKAACVRDAAGIPDGGEAPWPPPERADSPVELLDLGYTTLRAALDGRPLDSRAATWYPPDQTVGFWLRRMAHETIIHRIDAALTVGGPLPEVPAPLAVDGIDELLRVFLAFGSTAYREMFGPDLGDADGRVVRVEAGGRAWDVTLAPTGVVVTWAGDGPAAATVTGEPFDVLRWLYRRGGAPALAGDPAARDRLGALLRTATQ